ncbi:hypothetical protein BXZ70DRAFT_614196 [Cristinia sonorae]|uniref:Nucleolar protein 12 n=1 Tax=Cristinia sonorae TaxID=1940300 RepID=A0A8K0UVW5_9AGAR|nr:hypothetical protein BXZ70DRAFT_614196 [Cristinia sonorae]
MSLSSFLLGDKAKGKGKDIDDDIFAATVKAPAPSARPTLAVTPSASVSTKEKKRKLPDEPVVPSSSKRSRTKTESLPVVTKEDKKKDEKSHKSKKQSEPTSDGEVEQEQVPSPSKAPADAPGSASEEESSGDEEDSSQLVHESLLKGGKSRSRGKKSSAKFVPEGETSEQRDARTIFIGNVAVEVVKSRPLLKQLKKHITSHVPSAKIESVRLRSIAFQKPTAPLNPSETDSPASGKGKGKEGDPSHSEGRQHDRDRAASWRAKQRGDDEADEEASALAKKFMSTSEKKRVAFINQEIHSGIDSVNAYLVFAHPPQVDGAQPANSPMDPYEAAVLAAQKCDGTTFLERTIRVDVVRKAGNKAGLGKGGEIGGDPKMTVFVGNLDFGSKEEDLRVFFEGLVSAERGPPPARQEGGEASEDEEDTPEQGRKPNSWVKRVRIIRDKDTLLGKGFGYVQFVDRECVDEVLSMEETRLKFAKRKLRVQRCKTLPGTKTKISGTPTTSKNAKPTADPSRARPNNLSNTLTTPIPKGDPALGSKISHLSKEERKDVKKGDADRVARRLAKKAAKAKMTLVEKGVKARVSDRERTRKRVKDHLKGPGGKPSGEKAKRRVRSDRAVSKLNTKK